MARFSGIIPPLVTPLIDGLEVDYPSLAALVEYQINAGVHGLFVLGTSGEVMFHNPATRRRIVEFVARQNDRRLPLLVGAIDAATDQVIAHAKIAQSAGADAVVVTAPFYTKTHQAEIIDHFHYVRDAVDLPIVAYDIPFCTGVKLERRTTVAIARDGTIAGLKDSSGDDRSLRYVLLDMADHPEFFAMTGSEVTVDTALAMGAHGAVPALANVDPAGYVRVWNAAQRSDAVACRSEQENLCALSEITFVAAGRVSPIAAGIGGLKTALREMGVISTNSVVRPQQPLNTEEARMVVSILSRHKPLMTPYCRVVQSIHPQVRNLVPNLTATGSYLTGCRGLSF